MATTPTEIILATPTELLGPESAYELKRLKMKQDYDRLVLESSKMLAITSPEEAEQATDMGRVLQTAIKEVEEFFEPIKRQANAIHKYVVGHEVAFAFQLNLQKSRLGRMITEWNAKVEEERRERERQAQAEAERQAQAELMDRAVEMDEAGDSEAAYQILQEPVFVPVVAQSVQPEKPKGQVTKMAYRAVVTDLKALVKAVAEGRAPIQCLQADEVFLNAQAKAYKEAFSIPGVKLDISTNTHFRS